MRIPPLSTPLVRAALGAASCALLLAACAGRHPAPVSDDGAALARNSASAPAAQNPPDRIAAQNAATRALLALYRQAVADDPTLAPLWKKTAPAPNEATPAMLALTERVTPAEQGMLRELARRQDDYQLHMGELLRSHELAAPLLAQWREGARAGNALRAQLHNRAITWGEYNTRLRDIATAQRMSLADSADALQAHDDAALQAAARAAREAYGVALGSAATAASSAACEVIGRERYCQ